MQRLIKSPAYHDIHWNLGVVVMPTLPSLVAQQVAITTACGAVSDDIIAETKMSFRRNFCDWLRWKLSEWQLSVQPVTKISSKWHFRFNDDHSQVSGFSCHNITFLEPTTVSSVDVNPPKYRKRYFYITTRYSKLWYLWCTIQNSYEYCCRILIINEFRYMAPQIKYHVLSERRKYVLNS